MAGKGRLSRASLLGSQRNHKHGNASILGASNNILIRATIPDGKDPLHLLKQHVFCIRKNLPENLLLFVRDFFMIGIVPLERGAVGPGK
jgi:hypothetical protein